MTAERRGFVARSIAHGALAGACLGAIELVCVWHLPWIAGDGSEFTRGHLAFQGFVALAYSAWGALIAGLAASAARASRREAPSSTFVVALAFVLQGAAVAVASRGRAPSWTLVASACAVSWTATIALAIVAASVFSTRIVRSPSSARGPARFGLAATLASWIALFALGVARVGSIDDPRTTARTASPVGTNVLLVVLDTVRADHLSLYGCERDTTPQLRELAKSSIVFDAAVAPGDMTLSSHASLFTGLYPRSHGAHFDERGRGRALGRQFPTLAEALRDAGWSTSGVAANHVFFGRGFGLERGFGVFDARAPFEYELLHDASSLPKFAPSRLLHRALTAAAPESADLRHYRSAEDVLREGRELIDAASGSPWFVFLNLMDAHWPCVPPTPFDARYPGFDARFQSANWRYAMVEEVLTRGTRGVSAGERAHMESQYDGAIAYMDEQLGALVEHLARTGQLDRTLLVITSDHGEAFGEHGLVGHAVSVYEDQIHVPLLVRPPGGTAGRRVATPVSLVDVPRTVLGALGIAANPAFGGRDLLSGTSGGSAGCAAESFPNPERGGERLKRVQRAFRASSGWKIVSTEAGASELYDLNVDSAELRDLAASSERAAELRSALESWLRSTPEAAQDARGSGDDSTARLRALGY